MKDFVINFGVTVPLLNTPVYLPFMGELIIVEIALLTWAVWYMLKNIAIKSTISYLGVNVN